MKVSIDFTQDKTGRISGKCSECGKPFEGSIEPAVTDFSVHADEHDPQAAIRIRVIPWDRRVAA